MKILYNLIKKSNVSFIFCVIASPPEADVAISRGKSLPPFSPAGIDDSFASFTAHSL